MAVIRAAGAKRGPVPSTPPRAPVSGVPNGMRTTSRRSRPVTSGNPVRTRGSRHVGRIRPPRRGPARHPVATRRTSSLAAPFPVSSKAGRSRPLDGLDRAWGPVLVRARSRTAVPRPTGPATSAVARWSGRTRPGAGAAVSCRAEPLVAARTAVSSAVPCPGASTAVARRTGQVDRRTACPAGPLDLMVRGTNTVRRPPDSPPCRAACPAGPPGRSPACPAGRDLVARGTNTVRCLPDSRTGPGGRVGPAVRGTSRARWSLGSPTGPVVRVGRRTVPGWRRAPSCCPVPTGRQDDQAVVRAGRTTSRGRRAWSASTVRPATGTARPLRSYPAGGCVRARPCHRVVIPVTLRPS
ncbi:hypothetical protein SAMN04489726_3073 [Allokutzneria albata]|uniref:Uncharacterized protein n=1 Tax=Allokutzneria albata TaxID=211114 RepID=A0A1G9VJH5_ALLAB|nr:hypothetical protein SAMN04489726_3073 [Allokutzneria albata]